MPDPGADDLHAALRRLRRDVPRMSDLLGLAFSDNLSPWSAVVERKLLPRTSPDYPLIATICGGGSSGKSTLFNTLVGEPVSPTGGRAGMNRRVLIAARGGDAQSDRLLQTVFDPFGAMPEPMADRQALLTPGGPLYVLSGTIPRHLVLLDTPDFDTGARGVYANREAATGALETADVLVYIFTNSNYNNRDNTDFIAAMLTGVGRRKCFLVYRVYPSFETGEVLDHAGTVAANLYGADADRHVLGIYRVDDDNEVAAGRRPMAIRPARPGDPPFAEALGRLDHRAIRLELMDSILEDVLAQARRTAACAAASRERLALYLQALETAQRRCVQDALRRFPMDRVMGRFAQIWLATDPPHIRAMRKTGRILDLPVRTLVKTVRWARGRLADAPAPPAPPGFSDRVAEDLVEAANRLHRHALEGEISLDLPADDPLAQRIAAAAGARHPHEGGGGQVAPHPEAAARDALRRGAVPSHPAAAAAREDIRRKDWKGALDTILSQRQLLTAVSDDIDRELAALVDTFRAGMGFWEQTRQTFSAFLNVLPATVAVTYILSTGDPVGAAGVKVKLSGLFGLHDLYALVALPATTGLKKADLKQLEELIGPIASAWLSRKLQTVEALFEEHITAGLLTRLRDSTAARAQILPQSKHGIRRDQIDDCALKTCETLAEAGYRGYLVGGAVRDLLLGGIPKDFDVATDATPEQVRRLFRRTRWRAGRCAARNPDSRRPPSCKSAW